MEQLVNFINEHKHDLSKYSVNTYANCINKILTLCKTDDISYLYNNADNVIKIINNEYHNSNTRKMKYASLRLLLNIYIDTKTHKDTKAITDANNKYNDEIIKCTEDLKKNNTHTKTEEQKANWMTSTDVNTLDKILSDKVPDIIRTQNDLINLRNYIIYKFYNEQPSRNDVADSKFLYYKKGMVLSDEYNYIILNKSKKTIQYIMNVYKTAKLQGKKTIDINNDLYDLFNKYYIALKRFNNAEYFLYNDDCKTPLSRNRLGVIYSGLGKEINKKLGTTLNRHIAISNLVPIKAMEDLANKMGNSVNIQTTTYAKS